MSTLNTSHRKHSCSLHVQPLHQATVVALDVTLAKFFWKAVADAVVENIRNHALLEVRAARNSTPWQHCRVCACGRRGVLDLLVNVLPVFEKKRVIRLHLAAHR